MSQGVRTPDTTRAAIIDALQCPSQPTYQAIADRFGTSRKQIWRIANEAGVHRRAGRGPTPSFADEAREGSARLLNALLAFYARRVAA